MLAYETPIFFDMFFTYRTPYQAPSRITHFVAILFARVVMRRNVFFRQNAVAVCFSRRTKRQVFRLISAQPQAAQPRNPEPIVKERAVCNRHQSPITQNER